MALTSKYNAALANRHNLKSLVGKEGREDSKVQCQGDFIGYLMLQNILLTNNLCHQQEEFSKLRGELEDLKAALSRPHFTGTAEDSS